MGRPHISIYRYYIYIYIKLAPPRGLALAKTRFWVTVNVKGVVLQSCLALECVLGCILGSVWRGFGTLLRVWDTLTCGTVTGGPLGHESRAASSPGEEVLLLFLLERLLHPQRGSVRTYRKTHCCCHFLEWSACARLLFLNIFGGAFGVGRQSLS